MTFKEFVSSMNVGEDEVSSENEDSDVDEEWIPPGKRTRQKNRFLRVLITFIGSNHFYPDCRNKGVGNTKYVGQQTTDSCKKLLSCVNLKGFSWFQKNFKLSMLIIGYK